MLKVSLLSLNCVVFQPTTSVISRHSRQIFLVKKLLKPTACYLHQTAQIQSWHLADEHIETFFSRVGEAQNRARNTVNIGLRTLSK